MHIEIEGTLCEGQGQAASFTQLDWVRRQFREKIGFDPYPGTLNVRVRNREALAAWQTQPGIMLAPESADYCAAKCFRARIGESIPAAWIIPLVPNYPDDLVELMAPVPVRQVLRLQNGDRVTVRLESESGATGPE